MSVPRRGSALVAALVSVVALATWQLWPDATAATTTAAATTASTATAPTSLGKVTLATIGGTTYTAPLLAFASGGSAPVVSGGGSGGGAGKFAPTPVSLAMATSAQAPTLLRAITLGTHVQTGSVVLYAPGTTRPAERWTFSDVLVTSLNESAGSIGKPAKLALSLAYGKVTWATLNSSGATVSTYCFDLATNAAC